MDNINFIREYKGYSNKHTFVDVVYKSNRVYTSLIEEAPRTALRFMREATSIKENFDKIYKRNEIIYSKN